MKDLRLWKRQKSKIELWEREIGKNDDGEGGVKKEVAAACWTLQIGPYLIPFLFPLPKF